MDIKKRPSFCLALCVFLIIVSILTLGVFVLKVDIHGLLLGALFIVCIISNRIGYTLDDIMDGIVNSISRAMTALMIFILIGTIIGTWIYCGTVPTLICYGLKFLNPYWFLPLGLIICSLTSLATGTSWGTVGTVGIALMGMGVSIGIPEEVVAGMIISGAFFGDKMSPISDTTNLSAVSAGTDLYDHIKAMMYTTIPTYIIAIIIYTVLGRHYIGHHTIDYGEVNEIIGIIKGQFNISPILLLPMIVVFVLNLKKVPAIPAMAVGTVLGCVFAIVFQGRTLAEVITAINYGYTHVTENPLVDKLLVRGGIQNMMWTFSLSFIALALGGVLEKVGYLNILIENIINKIKSTGSLMTLVITSCFVSNAVMGEVYLSVILNGSMYKDTFEKKGLKKSMLSRAIEEGATLTGPLIPWTTAGAFVSATLGVPVWKYMPFALINLINPILSIGLTYLGIFVFKENKNEKLAAA